MVAHRTKSRKSTREVLWLRSAAVGLLEVSQFSRFYVTEEEGPPKHSVLWGIEPNGNTTELATDENHRVVEAWLNALAYALSSGQRVADFNKL